MNCEIEFLAVGDGEKAGDAIVIRYGDENAFHLMLVDGGHAETGDKIVAHLRHHFGPTPVLEHVVLTHSDSDHASGLRSVLREITVRNLWLHIPWLHSAETRHLFNDQRWTESGLADNIKSQYSIIAEILDLAIDAGCNIKGAFQHELIGPFRVCSPSREIYNYLLPQFDKTPEPNQTAIEAAGVWIGKQSAMQRALEATRITTMSWTNEIWHIERLRDGGVTNASNESSIVLYGAFDNGHRVLLTGDAGVRGLSWAADYLVSIGHPLQQFTFVQIPHHGSRRNVGPTVLDRLLGPIQPKGAPPRFTAYVSVPTNDTKHPRLIVLNAFKRRGGRVYATQGQDIILYGGFAKRNSYVDLAELPFYDQIEQYD